MLLKLNERGSSWATLTPHSGQDMRDEYRCSSPPTTLTTSSPEPSFMTNSIEVAMKLGSGLLVVSVVGGDEHLYSSRMSCPECGVNVAQLEPRSFSFNSMYGACQECNGLGSKYDFDPAKVIVDWSKPLLDGGLGPGAGSASLQAMVKRAAEDNGIDLGTPFEQLAEEQQKFLLYGDPSKRARSGFKGIFAFH